MENLNHLGVDEIVEIKGKTYKLGRFTMELWIKFTEFARKVLPNPLDLIRGKLEGFPPDIQEKLVREAYDRSYRHLSITSPEVTGVLNSYEGMTYLFVLRLQVYQPHITLEEGRQLFLAYLSEAGEGAAAESVVRATGVLPEDNEPQKKTVQANP